MRYLIEIINSNKEVVETKKFYTLEELRAFYKSEYECYDYRVYELKNIDIWE